MINDAYNDREITISKIEASVVSKAPCPMSGEPAPDPPPPGSADRAAKCPECLGWPYVRTNGNFYKHTARRVSDPRDVIVVQTGAKQVIEIDAADVPAFIAQLQAIMVSPPGVS